MIALKSPSTARYEQTDPDVRLMLAVQQGDQAAFDELVAQYYHRVLAVIQHLMGSPRQSEDLAQEVFLRVFRARSTYQPNAKFSTWLFVIVNNVVRNARRSLARRCETTVPFDNPVWRQPLDGDVCHETPDVVLLRGEVQQVIKDGIQALNARQRTAMMLYHYQGLSYAEIAKRMDTTLLAAKALLHRARVALRDNLESFANG